MEQKLSHVNILDSIDHQFYFVVIGNNHKVAATSEMYTQKHNALETAVLFNLPVIDLTQSARKLPSLVPTENFLESNKDPEQEGIRLPSTFDSWKKEDKSDY